MGRDTVTYIKIKPFCSWLWIGFAKQHPRDPPPTVKTVNVLQSKWKHSLQRWKFCKTLITKGVIIPTSPFDSRNLHSRKFGNKFRPFHTGWLLIILWLHLLEPPDPTSNIIKTTNFSQQLVHVLFCSVPMSTVSHLRLPPLPKGHKSPFPGFPQLPQGLTMSIAHPLGRQCLSCIPLSPGAQVQEHMYLPDFCLWRSLVKEWLQSKKWEMGKQGKTVKGD